MDGVNLIRSLYTGLLLNPVSAVANIPKSSARTIRVLDLGTIQRLLL